MRGSTLVLALLPPSGGGAFIASADLARAAGMSHSSLRHAIDRLVGRGLVTKARFGHYRRTAAGDRVAAAGAVIRPGPKRPGIDAAPAAPALQRDDAMGRNVLRDRAWAALRMLKKATVPELLELALRDEAPDAARARVSEYLSTLARRGVVARLRRRVKGASPYSPGFVQFLLVRDLGPQAPVVRRNGIVFDRNANAPLAQGE